MEVPLNRKRALYVEDDAGLINLFSEPQDLSDVCLGSLSLLRAAMPQSVIVETNLPVPGPVINAASNQIQQVLTNLTTNAWESGADRRNVIRLTVTTATAADIPATHRFPLDFRPQEKAYACLEVADAGGGIVIEEIKNLFDPFYTTKSVGRGMGLAVVLGIAQSLNGVVTLENHPGQGCTFRVF